MTSRTWRMVLVAALAVLVAACGTDAASSPTSEPTPTAAASSPTPEATPTTPAPSPTPSATPVRGPLDLITADPGADPDAFAAALPPDEAACVESAVSGHVAVVDVVAYLFAYVDEFEEIPSAADLEAAGECLGEETARRILIGQMDRLAGGLESETVSCMSNHATSSALASVFDVGEPTDDGPTDMMNLIFCLNASERAALESNDDYMFIIPREGFIDGMECIFNLGEAEGTSAFARLLALGDDRPWGSSPYDDPEFFNLLGEWVRVEIECGLMTDEDFQGSVFTAVQVACLYEEAGLAYSAYEYAVGQGRSAMPELELLLPALEVCGVSLDQLGDIDPTGVEPTPAVIEPTEGLPGLRKIGLALTEEQFQCIQANITPEESAQLAGGWTVQSLDLLVSLLEVHHETCSISLEAVFQ